MGRIWELGGKNITPERILAPLVDSKFNVNYNGELHLSNIGCDPFLLGILSAVPLKSKLVSIVLGPWFVDT